MSPRDRIRAARAAASLTVATLALLVPGANAATLSAPPTIRIGARLTVRAAGLRPGRYGLYIGVTKVAPSHGAAALTCVARIGAVLRSAGATTFRGPLPARLTCRIGAGPSTGTIALRPGRYVLLVASPEAPGAYNPAKSFRQGSITVLAAARAARLSGRRGSAAHSSINT